MKGWNDFILHISTYFYINLGTLRFVNRKTLNFREYAFSFQVLYSDNANSSVRVNFYHAPGERLMTANCARLTSVNNYATNGIVHVVDRMIRPVTKTLAQLLAQDSQFSVFISCKYALTPSRVVIVKNALQ